MRSGHSGHRLWTAGKTQGPKQKPLLPPKPPQKKTLMLHLPTSAILSRAQNQSCDLFPLLVVFVCCCCNAEHVSLGHSSPHNTACPVSGAGHCSAPHPTGRAVQRHSCPPECSLIWDPPLITQKPGESAEIHVSRSLLGACLQKSSMSTELQPLHSLGPSQGHSF